MNAEVQAAVIGAVAAALIAVPGTLITNNIQNGSERSRADLADLRQVLDDTAKHVGVATWYVQVIADRCETAAENGTAANLKELDAWISRSHVPMIDVRVDRERLRVRLHARRITDSYRDLDKALLEADTPCRQPLAADAGTQIAARLLNVYRLTERYYGAVVRKAGTQLP